MKKHSIVLVLLGLVFIVTISMSLIQCTNSTSAQTAAAKKESEDPISDNAKQMFAFLLQAFVWRFLKLGRHFHF